MASNIKVSDTNIEKKNKSIAKKKRNMKTQEDISTEKSSNWNNNDKIPKRIRKSSLVKAQKKFAIFDDTREHENKYEALSLSTSDQEEVIILDDEEKSGTNVTKSIKVVHVDDEQNNKSNNEAKKVKLNGGLEQNADFIGFSSSDGEQDASDEDSADVETENERSSSDVKVLGFNSEYPWILNRDHSKQREIADWLTLEIKDFISYISPSREEIRQRNEAISKLKAAVRSFWPDADLLCFGSYATDLYLPGSDIDCVVNSKGGDKQNKNALYSLASYLRRNGLATQVTVIAKARVPIIKFVEPQSQIHIDLSFERTNGVEAAKIIRGWLSETRGLRELVLIVKQFLHARKLNDVHIGGLGGFSIICLVYSFLQLHPRIICRDIDPMQNLGVLLIDFFELYGKNFGYDDVGITVTDNQVGYIMKRDHPELTQNLRGSFNLVIQDPGDPCNNISRGSFNVRDIKKAFAGAFDLLTNRCFELDASTFKHRVGKSILGNVIKYNGAKRDFKDERGLVINQAIRENEEFHQMRGRIVRTEYEGEFIDLSDEEEDLYKLEPAKKKVKTTKKNSKAPSIAESNNSDQSDGYDPAGNQALATTPRNGVEGKGDGYVPGKTTTYKNNVDKLMGLDNDDPDDYQPTFANEPSEEEEDDYNPRVDKVNKRKYWLNKGKSM
ncbi:HDL425Wp [Eremothecium sinecaudum]|uniref:polynucleotide adenylyltransferase n=1 Tax=Eremothecium sinecaudum TaxID=45286 RepID=A0A0X8HRX1_9SACH|nr:HDL425Wp [Eremothecium sinecaudum]AMD20319.1 HDL425Wp [Eremothecium sinecaudum]